MPWRILSWDSFFPSGFFSSIPNHSPSANWVVPAKRMMPAESCAGLKYWRSRTSPVMQNYFEIPKKLIHILHHSKPSTCELEQESSECAEWIVHSKFCFCGIMYVLLYSYVWHLRNAPYQNMISDLEVGCLMWSWRNEDHKPFIPRAHRSEGHVQHEPNISDHHFCS